MEKKKAKKKPKVKNDFFKTLKPVLIFSLCINIILLIFAYHLKTSSHLYIFAGDNEYLSVDSGVISLDNSVNCLVGNSIEFIGEKDIKIKEIKIGYYILERDENLKEVISHYATYEEGTSLKQTIKEITSLNISENAKKSKMFKVLNTEHIDNNLYIVMEIKNDKGEKIVSKLQLDVSKIR